MLQKCLKSRPYQSCSFFWPRSRLLINMYCCYRVQKSRLGFQNGLLMWKVTHIRFSFSMDSPLAQGCPNKLYKDLESTKVLANKIIMSCIVINLFKVPSWANCAIWRSPRPDKTARALAVVCVWNHLKLRVRCPSWLNAELQDILEGCYFVFFIVNLFIWRCNPLQHVFLDW